MQNETRRRRQARALDILGLLVVIVVAAMPGLLARSERNTRANQDRRTASAGLVFDLPADYPTSHCFKPNDRR